MFKKIGISKTQAILGFSCIMVVEIVSFARYTYFSKTNQILGTDEGFLGIIKDSSDPQWNYFESNFPLLFAFQLGFLFLSYLTKKYSDPKNKLHNLQRYNIIVGMGLSFFLHNFGMIFQFVLICLFYYFQKLFNSVKHYSILIWILAIAVLYSNELNQGYQLSSISTHLQILDDIKQDYQLIRWNISFNLILLRILSFAFDHSWAQQAHNQKSQDSKPIDESAQKSFKQIVNDHQPLEEYNFLSYLSYIYYAPLFFAGPTVTFNGYQEQIKTPQRTYSTLNVWKYVARVYLLDFLTFYIFLHCCYPNAIPKVHENYKLWQNWSMFDLHAMSFYNLCFLWYKFLTIWRITRAWALLDGIETPENMNRCIYNNYNFTGFWRSWHRSFNQWLIRYIYIPLGGSKYKILNMWAVFTFVAMWHDFKLDLILWAWLICLALIPEIAIISYFSKKDYYKHWWFKAACAFAGGFQIEMMSLANLIGFGSGHEGMQQIVTNYFSISGFLFLLATILFRNGPVVLFQIYIRANEDQVDKNF